MRYNQSACAIILIIMNYSVATLPRSFQETETNGEHALQYQAFIRNLQLLGRYPEAFDAKKATEIFFRELKVNEPDLSNLTLLGAKDLKQIIENTYAEEFSGASLIYSAFDFLGSLYGRKNSQNQSTANEVAIERFFFSDKFKSLLNRLAPLSSQRQALVQAQDQRKETGDLNQDLHAVPSLSQQRETAILNIRNDLCQLVETEVFKSSGIPMSIAVPIINKYVYSNGLGLEQLISQAGFEISKTNPDRIVKKLPDLDTYLRILNSKRVEDRSCYSNKLLAKLSIEELRNITTMANNIMTTKPEYKKGLSKAELARVVTECRKDGKVTHPNTVAGLAHELMIPLATRGTVQSLRNAKPRNPNSVPKTKIDTPVVPVEKPEKDFTTVDEERMISTIFEVIETTLKEGTYKKLQVPVITRGLDLDKDLEIDPFDRPEIALRLEDEFSINLAVEEDNWKTVEDIINSVAERIKPYKNKTTKSTG